MRFFTVTVLSAAAIYFGFQAFDGLGRALELAQHQSALVVAQVSEAEH